MAEGIRNFDAIQDCGRLDLYSTHGVVQMRFSIEPDYIFYPQSLECPELAGFYGECPLPLERKINKQELPGVYCFFDAYRNVALYIGKALRLRNRLQTYYFRRPEWFERWHDPLKYPDDLHPELYHPMVAVWLSDERAVLEHKFIQELQPLFNVHRQLN